ncbi:MAG TPA: hypothetical protein VGD40_03245 [Chryseosolibacter sp.]
MKKLFYILLIAMTASLTITSCTEENVEPQTSGNNGGGGASEPGD